MIDLLVAALGFIAQGIVGTFIVAVVCSAVLGLHELIRYR